MPTARPRKRRGAAAKSASAGSAWSVAEAKARFSEVIELAREQGPQQITRNGKRAAVLVSAEEWDRKTRRKGTLADFFRNSPLRGSGIVLERLDEEPRDLDL